MQIVRWHLAATDSAEGSTVAPVATSGATLAGLMSCTTSSNPALTRCVQGAAMPQRTKFGSSLPWGQVIDPAERLAHKQGAVAVREVVGDAKRLAALLVGQ